MVRGFWVLRMWFQISNLFSVTQKTTVLTYNVKLTLIKIVLGPRHVFVSDPWSQTVWWSGWVMPLTPRCGDRPSSAGLGFMSQFLLSPCPYREWKWTDISTAMRFQGLFLFSISHVVVVHVKCCLFLLLSIEMSYDLYKQKVFLSLIPWKPKYKQYLYTFS